MQNWRRPENFTYLLLCRIIYRILWSTICLIDSQQRQLGDQKSSNVGCQSEEGRNNIRKPIPPKRFQKGLHCRDLDYHSVGRGKPRTGTQVWWRFESIGMRQEAVCAGMLIHSNAHHLRLIITLHFRGFNIQILSIAELMSLSSHFVTALFRRGSRRTCQV